LSLQTTQYELFGIINHQGNMFGGHYFSYIKKNDWYSFDDTTITKIDTKAINDNKNYCLFYRKIK
jgi:ubiquitin carboxyl-terminal hydrolase 8